MAVIEDDLVTPKSEHHPLLLKDNMWEGFSEGSNSSRKSIYIAWWPELCLCGFCTSCNYIFGETPAKTRNKIRHGVRIR